MKSNAILLVVHFSALSINCLGQVRLDLVTDFTPTQRTTLVNLMQQYITEEMIEYHCDYIKYTIALSTSLSFVALLLADKIRCFDSFKSTAFNEHRGCYCIAEHHHTALTGVK